MRNLEELFYNYFKTSGTYMNTPSSPNIKSMPKEVRLSVPYDFEITDLDVKLIKTLLAYKRHHQDKTAKHVRSQQSESQEAIDLANFIYDHLDDLEESLDDKDYQTLESLIMNIKT